MRVVLLLTVGLPVFAAQLVAYALPRVEVTPFTLLRRVAVESEQNQSKERLPVTHREQPLLVVVPPALDDVEFLAPVAPVDSSARALLFVKHVRRQAS